MVLVQIIITPQNNNSFFAVGISGRCSIRVLSYDHHDTGNTARLIQVQSEQLVFPYSPARYLTVMTNQHSTHTVDDSEGGFHINNCILNGGIQINIIDRATGVEPDNFTFGLLTLSITEINHNIQVE